MKEPLESNEKYKLLDSLAKVGFKKDKYVTLSELFSYIQSRVSNKNAYGQRPTITTSYMSFTEPVRLSYFENKINLRLTYPGTIFVKRIKEGNV